MVEMWIDFYFSFIFLIFIKIANIIIKTENNTLLMPSKLNRIDFLLNKKSIPIIAK